MKGHRTNPSTDWTGLVIAGGVGYAAMQCWGPFAGAPWCPQNASPGVQIPNPSGFFAWIGNLFQGKPTGPLPSGTPGQAPLPTPSTALAQDMASWQQGQCNSGGNYMDYGAFTAYYISAYGMKPPESPPAQWYQFVCAATGVPFGSYSGG